MTCDTYEVLLEKWLSGEASAEEEEAMLAHEEACGACRGMRAAILELDGSLALLAGEVPDMPSDFHERWTSRLDTPKEAKRPVRSRLSPAMKRTLAAAAAAVFILGGTFLTRDTLGPRTLESSFPARTVSPQSSPILDEKASGTIFRAEAPNNEVTYDMEEAEWEEAAEEAVMTASYSAVSSEADESDGGMPSADAAERKIVRSGSMSLATADMDGTLASLQSLCKEKGGWVAYSSDTADRAGGRQAQLTLKLPADAFDQCMEEAGSLGRVLRRETHEQDLTESYRDRHARLQTQLALMEQYRSLVDEAASVSELIELEQQMAQTQYEIDTLTSSLAATDSRVSFSTLEIQLREEQPEAGAVQSDASLASRLRAAFSLGIGAAAGFLRDALLFLTAALPFLVPATLLALVIFWIRKHRRSRRG